MIITFIQLAISLLSFTFKAAVVICTGFNKKTGIYPPEQVKASRHAVQCAFHANKQDPYLTGYTESVVNPPLHRF